MRNLKAIALLLFPPRTSCSRLKIQSVDKLFMISQLFIKKIGMLRSVTLLLALNVSAFRPAALAQSSRPAAALDAMVRSHEEFDDVLDRIFDGPADVLVGTKVSLEPVTAMVSETRSFHLQPGGRLTVPATMNPVNKIVFSQGR